MVHADASTFSSGQSKEEIYKQVLASAEALFAEQRNWVCNLANTSSLLYHALRSLPSPSASVNWVGFYTMSPYNLDRLILGPFQGHVACQSIEFAQGVCGMAAAMRMTRVVPDVEKEEGHIACDAKTKSEIVVPIVKDDMVVAVLDCDCEELEGFDETDKAWLEKLAHLIAASCDF